MVHVSVFAFAAKRSVTGESTNNAIILKSVMSIKCAYVHGITTYVRVTIL